MSTLSPAVYKRIEEWVSNTDGESSRARASTSNPPIVMSAPRPLRYIHTREQPIEQPDPYLTVEGKKEHLEYERRPRRKTKEDRYEYKVKKAHGRLKNPIKDNFHASNVPCDRLTLNPNQPLGIFSKGKASAPVKACHGYNYVHPDPRFSEKRFLLGWEAPSPSVNDSTSESNERVYGYGYPNFRAPEHPDVACNAPSQGEDYPRRQATAPEVATNNVQTLELAPGRGSERLHAELSNLQSSAPDTNQDRLQAASLDKDDNC
ncbi:hypothetical protein BO71DRAFT_442228 [Aspergillus ellipticus CBS 707.79]|uniref:Uncharacterized protein n=1 Tax=Aspergillus ellipticus CBS 707.79 TaxID=1448320 RepID=A0A319D617_9EURO|nr:hypothetical protein BO71DRAFT_442228 [Aspergillus ellipticus CBS 707.79]